MSRYLILVLLTAPFVIAGLVNALVEFKLRRISKRRYAWQCVLWAAIFAGIASVKPIYEFLFSHNLTETEPLSLFDVVLITSIIAMIFVINRNRAKVETLERRVQDLHQELSIKLAEFSQKK